MARLKDKKQEYFKNKVEEIYRVMNASKNRLDKGDIPSERINSIKHRYVLNYLSIIMHKYSAGYEIKTLEEDLISAINLTNDSWVGDKGIKFHYQGKYLKQFVSYEKMLWMLSLGYLLNIDEVYFHKLVEVIDRHGVKDVLLEFIIRARIKDRILIKEESYEFGWDLFGKLRKAISESDKEYAANLISNYIAEDFGVDHTNTGLYSVKGYGRSTNSYTAYWCFEIAAITKIMGLDDSSYRDWQYYPKDLADYYDKNHK